MSFISIEFGSAINVSCQPGDEVYNTSILPQDTNNTLFSGNMSGVALMGIVHEVINPNGLNNEPILIILDIGNNSPAYNVGDFLMFSKNKQANTSGITGYYAEIDFFNNSRDKAELFSVGSLAEISSK
tara:strand:- start:1395 stop:1778 length:384 start_codon:yes stop_codon:yes gene_type:complete